MNEINEPRRGPGRPRKDEQEATFTATARQEETQARRRRRESLGPDRNLKLHVPEDMKDPNFVYRWVNNRPGRVQQLTRQDDWDVVQGADPAANAVSLGATSERVADSYTGQTAVLLRKPKEFYEADKAEEQKLLDARDETMRRGSLNSPEGLSGPEAYVPNGRNIVSGR